MDKKFISILLGFAVIVLGFKAFYQYSTVDHLFITVTEKERIVSNTSEGVKSKYLIFTENEVFENTDAWFHLKFNSSDVYGKIKVGETYEAKVYGWRIPFLSWYRNIIEIK